MPMASRGIINGQRVRLQTLQDTADTQIKVAFASAHMAMSPQVADFTRAYGAELHRVRNAVPAGERDDEEENNPNATVPLAWLFTSGELKKLTEVIQKATEAAAAASADAASAGVDDAATAGVESAENLTRLAQPGSRRQQAATQVNVPKGDAASLLAQAQALNPENQDKVGVDETIDGIPSAAVKDTRNSVVTGLVAGLASQAMQQAVMMGVQDALTSALTASRNGIADAFNQTVNLTITQNASILSGWVWTAQGGACIACLEMDGSIHGWDEDLNSHVGCKCMQVPYTGPLPGDFLTGDQWFNQQSDLVQQEILGPSKYLAWKSGDVQLMDFVDHSGGYISERSLKSLGLDARDYLQTLPTAAEKREMLDAFDAAVAERNAVEAVPAYLEEAIYMGKEAELMLPSILEANPELAKLTAQHDTLQAQRDAIQTKLDTLSAKWGDLVLKQSVFDPEEDPEEIARMEAQIVKVESQQATQMAKMDTLDAKIAALDSKIAEAKMPPSEKMVVLRQQLDEKIANRELLYSHQHDLVEEQTKLGNEQRHAQEPDALSGAEYRAKLELYHESLDQTDPAVKQYLKDLAANTQARKDSAAALAEQRRLDKLMDTLSIQGKRDTAEFAQAKKDYEAAVAQYMKVGKAQTKSWDNLWQKSPGVYKPELDSIGGFNNRLNPITRYDDYGHPIRTPIFTPEQIASNHWVVAAQERIANLSNRVADVRSQLAALEKPIKDINKEIDRSLAQMREMSATLGTGTKLMDATRPFSDVIELPAGHQPPTALMNKLDYKMHEPRAVTKGRIIDDINARLKGNPDWMAYVARTGEPNLGNYHPYVHVQANANDTKSAKLVADWIKKWGVGYRPGSPEWIAMQMATRDEFGLDAAIHGMRPDQIARGERFYAENGAALRAFMRAQYDNTQKWFADHGITEIDAYRGFGWNAPRQGGYNRLGQQILERNPDVPTGIDWGEIAGPRQGVGDIALNPFQSFSADINVSAGRNPTAGVGAFATGKDYNLLIGAKIPVDRVLATAQTGFGAKLESEIVIMGRATDTVKYEASTKVEAELVKHADEQAMGEGSIIYTTADGAKVSVTAAADGTFTIAYESGTQATLGGLKLDQSKTYKTVKSINQTLGKMRISNTYVAPVTKPTVEVAGQTLTKFAEPVVLNLPPLDAAAQADVIQVAQDALSSAGVTSHEDAIALGSQIDDYLNARIGDLADYGQQAAAILVPGHSLSGDDIAWLQGDLSSHGGLTVQDALAQYSQARQQEVVSLLSQTRDVGGVDLNVVAQDQTVADAISQVQDALPTDWLAAANEDGNIVASAFPAGHQGEGFYSPRSDGTGGKVTLKYDPNSPNVEQQLYTNAAHELAHVMEDRVDGLWQMEQAFYNARTDGEKFVALNNGIAKMTKVDQFIDPYLGRQPILYRLGDGRSFQSYELLSRGLEWVLGQSATSQYYLAADEEFHQFILGLLFGAKNKVVLPR